MDPLRRLYVALETGSFRAFIGEELARRADGEVGHRVDGEELLDWIESRFEPQDVDEVHRRDRLLEFITFVRADGGFEEMAAKVRMDLGIASEDDN
ncbi:hypothetical protein OAS39_02925 [Pirellulales bacterium]|nr:hypothetical protein [Pirellulales bacterium]